MGIKDIVPIIEQEVVIISKEDKEYQREILKRSKNETLKICCQIFDDWDQPNNAMTKRSSLLFPVFLALMIVFLAILAASRTGFVFKEYW